MLIEHHIKNIEQQIQIAEDNYPQDTSAAAINCYKNNLNILRSLLAYLKGYEEMSRKLIVAVDGLKYIAF